jgi:hypothetical protein
MCASCPRNHNQKDIAQPSPSAKKHTQRLGVRSVDKASGVGTTTILELDTTRKPVKAKNLKVYKLRTSRANQQGQILYLLKVAVLRWVQLKKT